MTSKCDGKRCRCDAIYYTSSTGALVCESNGIDEIQPSISAKLIESVEELYSV